MASTSSTRTIPPGFEDNIKVTPSVIYKDYPTNHTPSPQSTPLSIWDAAYVELFSGDDVISVSTDDEKLPINHHKLSIKSEDDTDVESYDSDSETVINSPPKVITPKDPIQSVDTKTEKWIHEPTNDAARNHRNRFRACIILGALGDTIGYHNGNWEFCYDTDKIRKEFAMQGGPKEFDVKSLSVSDDTVLNLATIRSLIESFQKDWKTELSITRKHYVNSFRSDMNGRAPGTTTGMSISLLEKGSRPAFNLEHKTCGGAMRAAPIGLRYHRQEDTGELLWTAIEYCRLTHNGPLAYMGSFLNALFTSYAINQIDPCMWINLAIKTETMVIKEINTVCIDAKEHIPYVQWTYNFMKQYATDRFPSKVDGEFGEIDWDTNYPFFLGHYEKDPQFTDNVFRELSREPDGKTSWSGSCGISSVLIAYDALLYAIYWNEFSSDVDFNNVFKNPEMVDLKYYEKVWELTIIAGMLHGGDNDSTGIIVGGFYGALFGARGVTKNLIEDIEYLDLMWGLANQLWSISIIV